MSDNFSYEVDKLVHHNSIKLAPPMGEMKWRKFWAHNRNTHIVRSCFTEIGEKIDQLESQIDYHALRIEAKELLQTLRLMKSIVSEMDQIAPTVQEIDVALCNPAKLLTVAVIEIDKVATMLEDIEALDLELDGVDNMKAFSVMLYAMEEEYIDIDISGVSDLEFEDEDGEIFHHGFGTLAMIIENSANKWDAVRGNTGKLYKGLEELHHKSRQQLKALRKLSNHPHGS